MTEANDYIDWDTVGQRKPFGLWFLQAYFLFRSVTFAYVAFVFVSNASALPFAFWLLPLAFASSYIVGIAAAQGAWRYSRALCIALMLGSLALEVFRHFVSVNAGPADQFRFELKNEGERLGADLVHVYGPALQVLLLLYLVFSRHVREFIERRRRSGLPSPRVAAAAKVLK